MSSIAKRGGPCRCMALLAVGLMLAACGEETDDGGSGASPPAGGSGGTGASAGSGGTSTGGSGTGGSGTGNTGGSSPCGALGDAEPAKMVGMTAAHNAIRCSLPAPGPVPGLQWSASLAAVAQSYAEQLAAQQNCNLQHSGGPYGENLFGGTGSYGPNDVVGAWASEDGCFAYGSFPDCCSCTCGHYTQIVWRNSVSLGCGYASCGGSEVWVCNYDPPGNYLGQNPY